jgi:hypothetical protein
VLVSRNLNRIWNPFGGEVCDWIVLATGQEMEGGSSSNSQSKPDKKKKRIPIGHRDYAKWAQYHILSKRLVAETWVPDDLKFCNNKRKKEESFWWGGN